MYLANMYVTHTEKITLPGPVGMYNKQTRFNSSVMYISQKYPIKLKKMKKRPLGKAQHDILFTIGMGQVDVVFLGYLDQQLGQSFDVHLAGWGFRLLLARNLLCNHKSK